MKNFNSMIKRILIMLIMLVSVVGLALLSYAFKLDIQISAMLFVILFFVGIILLVRYQPKRK